MSSNNNIQYSGEYKVDKLELITANGKFDLSGNFVQIDLFESIFNHTMSGSLTFFDTNNLIINSPVVGQEFLKLKISSPGIINVNSINYSENVLSVYKVGLVDDVSKGSQLIELHLISPEALTNQRVRVSKSYVSSFQDVVEDVLTNKVYLDSRKNIFLEPSRSEMRLVSPNVHPFDLISYVASESTDEFNFNTYLFYENTQGFHFKSLSRLFENPTQANFHGGDVGTVDKKTKDVEDFNRVISYNRNGSVDMLQNIVSGMMGSNLITHNLYEKKYEKYEYNYFNPVPSIEDNGIYLNSQIDYQGRTVGDFPDSKIHLRPLSKSYTRGENDNDQNGEGDYSSLTTKGNLLTRRSKFAEMLGTINYNIQIAGYTGIKVGDMINFSIPTVGNDHGKGVENDYMSGKFLIKKLRHTFYRSPVTKHEIAMEITKDSFKIPLPTDELEQPIKDSGFVAKVSGDDDYGGM